MPNSLAETLSSTDPMEKAAAELSMLGIKHVNKSLVSYLGGVDNLKKNKDEVKFVYLTESLNDDFEIMKDLLSLGNVSLPTDDVSAHRMPGEMSNKLTDKARENLLRWYREDTEIYEHCKNMHQQFVERYSGKASMSAIADIDEEELEAGDDEHSGSKTTSGTPNPGKNKIRE